jgi:cyclase
LKTVRIIPRLDIKGPNLVKGVHLEGLRVLGDPREFARYYYETGADELIYMDVVASLYNRNSLNDIITSTAKEIFIPLTVGGGIRSIDDIKSVLRAGADKVAINTAALRNPGLVSDAAKIFGSSTIVIAIEAIRQPDGKYLAYAENGREYTGIEVVGWAKKVEDLGAGELLVISVDREGTGGGFDTELIKIIGEAVSIPVIAHGGAGKPEHLGEVILQGKADAVALSSMLHYDHIKSSRNVFEDKDEGNREFLKRKETFSKICPKNLREIKGYLCRQGINCRSDEAVEAEA